MLLAFALPSVVMIIQALSASFQLTTQLQWNW